MQPTPNGFLKGPPASFGGRPALRERLRFMSPLLPALDQVLSRYVKAYRKGLITNGDLVAGLEAAVAERLGVRHCVAVSSCTSGLMMVLRALSLCGEVILPSFTFFATGHAIRWNGLEPVFADCDADTWNLDPADIERRITLRTSAIVAVHLYGNPCDISALERLARRHGLKLVFDAAHGFGSEYHGKALGQFGDAEVFSLSPTKLLIAGEGGLVTTNDVSIARAVRSMRNYGDLGAYNPEWIGLNARMSEFNAALALAGLPLVEAKVQRRNHIARLYTQLLSSQPGLGFQRVSPGNRSTYKDYSVHVTREVLGISRDALVEALLAENIETKKYFHPPLHEQTVFQKFYNPARDGLRRTNEVSDGVLSLPIYETLDDEIIETIVQAIHRIVTHRTVIPTETPERRNQNEAFTSQHSTSSGPDPHFGRLP